MIRSRGEIIFPNISNIKCQRFLALHFGVVSLIKSVVLLILVEVMKLMSLTCKVSFNSDNADKHSWELGAL